MKLPSIFGAALAGGSHIVSTASSLAILVGAIYLVDCRVSARGTDAIDRCYLSALPMMGLGAGTADALSRVCLSLARVYKKLSRMKAIHFKRMIGEYTADHSP